MQADWRASPIDPAKKRSGRAGRVELLDLNLLPARHRPRRLSLADIAPWVASLGLALLVLPIFNRFQEVNRSYQALQFELASQQRILAGESEAQKGIEAMESELNAVQLELDALAASYETFRIQDVAWNSVLSAVAAELPHDTSLIRIDQNGSQIRVRGESAEHQLVLVYSDRLAALPDVIDISIVRIERTTAPPSEDAGQDGEPPAQRTGFEFEFLLTMSGRNSLEAQEDVDSGQPSVGSQ